MKNNIKRSLSRKLGYNVELNKRALGLKKSWDEITTVLKIEKDSKKK